MERLPRELLHQILALLPFEQLKQILLVNRQLCQAGTNPSLWSSFPLVLSSNNLAHISDIFALPRLARLKHVKAQGCRLLPRHLKAIFGSPIESMTIGNGQDQATARTACPDIERDVELSQLAPTILADLVTRLKEVNLHNSLMHQLSEKQMLGLAGKMEQPTSKLEKLEIFFDNHLISLPPPTLARALANLTHLSLAFQKLAAEKYDRLFQEMLKGESKLESINLYGNNLSHVDNLILAEAISKIKSANLTDTKLSSMHLSRLKRIYFVCRFSVLISINSKASWKSLERRALPSST